MLVIPAFIGLGLSGCLAPVYSAKIPQAISIRTQDSEQLIQVSIENHIIDWNLISRLSSKARAAIPPPVSPEILDADYDYVLGPKDRLIVDVWGHPELSFGFLDQSSNIFSERQGDIGRSNASFSLGRSAALRRANRRSLSIDDDGYITLPYAGKVMIANLNLKQAEQILTETIDKVVSSELPTVVYVDVDKYLSQYAVIITEDDYQEIPITKFPRTIVDALADINKFSDIDWSQVILSRDDKRYTLNLRNLLRDGQYSDAWVLRHGDVIRARPNFSNTVYVMGEFRIRGPIPLPLDGLDLGALLAQADPNASTASVNNIHVIRAIDVDEDLGIPNKIQIFTLDGRNVQSSIMASAFEIQPGDYVIAPSIPITRWNRFISQLLPSFTFLNRADDFYQDFIETP